MKKTFINIRLAALRALVGSFALLALLAFVLPQAAQANMAANTQIKNAAQLSYFDGATTQTANASVTVTVALVPSAAIDVAGPNQTTEYAGVNTQLSNTFTVTATANGLDSYTLTPTLGGGGINETGASVSLTSPSSPVSLGATVTLANCTTTTLYVPSDGTADSTVNGISAGTVVVIGSDTRTVTSVTDPGGSGIATIVLPALSIAPAAGVLVAQQVVVTVLAKSGTITASGQSIVITKTLTVASTTDPTKTTTSGAVTDTYTSGLATFAKYVRNVTNPIVGGGATTSYGGNTYYTTGVTAKPSEVLEYIVTVTNSGTGNISSCVVTDTIPVNYANFNTTPYSGSTAVTYVNESNAVSYLTATAGDDAATWSSPTLTVNVGTGAGIPPAPGGTIAAGNIVKALYQVSVK
jgi:hypothetical protein